MKRRKIFSIMILCLILCNIFTLNSFAYIECDGKINIYEWEDCEQTVLFRGTNASGNAYHSFCVKHRYIEEDRRIYLGVMLENINSQSSESPENATSEIHLSFNNSSEIVLRSDLTADYNENEFSVNFGCLSDSFGGSNYEVECVLKELEYDDVLTVNISAKDYNGEVTQIYQIYIESEEKKEEESQSVAESEKESEKEAKKSQKNKTTKKSVRTTKPKTTKKAETTTEFITAIITEDYETYSEKAEKNNRSIIIIGVACVVTSIAAVCVSLFQKEKK